jgi:hypothetical protein
VPADDARRGFNTAHVPRAGAYSSATCSAPRNVSTSFPVRRTTSGGNSVIFWIPAIMWLLDFEGVNLQNI